jgi:tetratricopeptide (TPR) repeat protein
MSVHSGDDTPAGKARAGSANVVGYKLPPVHTRFKPGESGNRKGRPRGRRNVADLMKDLFNQTVPVRSGSKTRKMPNGEAMIRVLVNNAGQGSAAALYLIIDILEMTGQTNAVTEEERKKRGMRLPRPLTPEEGDLAGSPARERDRQRFLAMAESDDAGSVHSDDGDSPPEIIPLAIKTGDEYAAQGRLDDALAAYRIEVARLKTDLLADETDKQAQADFRRAVARIGLLADGLLLAGDFERAINFADEAIEESATPFWIATPDPIGNVSANTVWISAIRAHARMFLGYEEDARKFYLSFDSNKRLVITCWENAILQDFARLRQAGHSHRLMDEMEKRFADAGWTTQLGNKMSRRPEMNGEDSVFVQTHPDEIKSGDLLDQHGKPEGAAAAYLRNLKRWQAKLKLGGASPAAEANIQIAVGRIGRMAQKFLIAGCFAQARDCAEAAIAAAPDSLELHAIRAHALMFLDQDNDARALFLQHRGQRIGDRPWEAVIVEGFEEHRKAGRSKQLMELIERDFAASGGTAQAPAANRPTGGTSGISVSALVQASDVQSAEMLHKMGMPDEALAVCHRYLKDCESRIAKVNNGQFNVQVIDDRNTVLEKIHCLAGELLLNGDFQKAHDALDPAISPALNAPLFNIYRAHALMLLDRTDEARPLYLQCCPAKVDADQIGKSLVLRGFVALRRAGHAHPMMVEIAKMIFDGGKNCPTSA